MRAGFDVIFGIPAARTPVPVRCFGSERSVEVLARRIDSPSQAQSTSFSRKSTALARRCGNVGGWLLPHISTADTARDLDHLRRLVGDSTLTCVDCLWHIPRTDLRQYVSRSGPAMLLDGVVDRSGTREAPRLGPSAASGVMDEVFNQFLDLCRRAGPERCCARWAPSNTGRALPPNASACVAHPYRLLTPGRRVRWMRLTCCCRSSHLCAIRSCGHRTPPRSTLPCVATLQTSKPGLACSSPRKAGQVSRRRLRSVCRCLGA